MSDASKRARAAQRDIATSQMEILRLSGQDKGPAPYASKFIDGSAVEEGHGVYPNLPVLARAEKYANAIEDPKREGVLTVTAF